jgi:hypothetical protein
MFSLICGNKQTKMVEDRLLVTKKGDRGGKKGGVVIINA